MLGKSRATKIQEYGFQVLRSKLSTLFLSGHFFLSCFHVKPETPSLSTAYRLDYTYNPYTHQSNDSSPPWSHGKQVTWRPLAFLLYQVCPFVYLLLVTFVFQSVNCLIISSLGNVGSVLQPASVWSLTARSLCASHTAGLATFMNA